MVIARSKSKVYSRSCNQDDSYFYVPPPPSLINLSTPSRTIQSVFSGYRAAHSENVFQKSLKKRGEGTFSPSRWLHSPTCLVRRSVHHL